MTFFLTEEVKQATKEIIVADTNNKLNYQYLLDDKNWVKINKFPDSVGDIYGVFEIDNVFYVVGDKGIATLNKEFYKLPSNMIYHWYTSCQVENNVLLIRINYHANADCKLFNTVSKQWSDVNIHTARDHFDVVHYLNEFWIVGGRERDDDYKITNTIQVLDTKNKKNFLSPVKMIQPRINHKVIVYKNKLFVFGGYFNGYLNTVEMYSPDTNKFITMAPMKIARSEFACCRVGNLVYVICGYIGNYKYSKSVQIYNLDTDVWCNGTNFPIASTLGYSNSHACAVNNKLE